MQLPKQKNTSKIYSIHDNFIFRVVSNKNRNIFTCMYILYKIVDRLDKIICRYS